MHGSHRVAEHVSRISNRFNGLVMVRLTKFLPYSADQAIYGSLIIGTGLPMQVVQQ